MAKHVFPTPPFWLIMAITGITAALLRTTILPKYLCTITPFTGRRPGYCKRQMAVVDFGARRTHGVDAANKFARVSYLAGFAGTSNVMAAGLYGRAPEGK